MAAAMDPGVSVGSSDAAVDPAAASAAAASAAAGGGVGGAAAAGGGGGGGSEDERLGHLVAVLKQQLFLMYGLDSVDRDLRRQMQDFKAEEPLAYSVSDALLRMKPMELAADVAGLEDAVAAVAADPQLTAIVQAQDMEMARSFQQALQAATGTIHAATVGPAERILRYTGGAHLFAAQTMRDRLRGKFDELSTPEIRAAVRTSLLTHLRTFAPALNSQLARHTVSVLSQAIAVLAVWMYTRLMPDPTADPVALAAQGLQVPMVREWPTPIDDCANNFSDDLESAMALLSILTEFPVEVDNHELRKLVGKIQIADYHGYLVGRGEYVLEIVANFARAAEQYKTAEGVPVVDPIRIRRKTLLCTQEWVAYGDYSADALAKNPVVWSAFDSIGTDDLFHTCTDVISGLIRQTRQDDTADGAALVSAIVPRVMRLAPMLRQAIEEEDEEVIAGLGNVFVEMAYYYSRPVVEAQILFEEDPSRVAYSWAGELMEVMLLIFSYRGEDFFSIPKLTWTWWYKLYKECDAIQRKRLRVQLEARGLLDPPGKLVKASRYQNEKEIAAQHGVEAPPPPFRAQVTRLLAACVHVARLPSPAAGEVVEGAPLLGLASDDMDKLRGQIGDQIRDAVFFLGDEVVATQLNGVLQSLRAQATAPPEAYVDPTTLLGFVDPDPVDTSAPEVKTARIVQAMEATLFCIQHAWPTFSPTVLASLAPPLIESLPAMAAQAPLAQRAFDLAGQWGSYLKSQPTLLPSVVEVLVSSVPAMHEQLRGASALVDAGNAAVEAAAGAADLSSAAAAAGLEQAQAQGELAEQTERQYHEILRSATRALERLSVVVGPEMVAAGFLELIVGTYEALGDELAPQRRRDLVQSCSEMVISLSETDADAGLRTFVALFPRLLTPPLAALQQLLATVGNVAQEALEPLKLVYNILRYSSPNFAGLEPTTPELAAAAVAHPAYEFAAAQVWPTLRLCLTKFNSVRRCMDSTSYAVKYLVKMLGATALPLVGEIGASLVAAFKASPFSGLLYAYHELIGVAGHLSVPPDVAASGTASDESVQATQLLTALVDLLQDAVLPRLESVADFSDAPSLVTEWIEILARLIRRNPLLAVTHTSFAEAFDRIMYYGLKMMDRECARSAALFFDHLFCASFERDDPAPQSTRDMLSLHLSHLASTKAAQLVECILDGVAGPLNHHATKSCASILTRLPPLIGPNAIAPMHSWFVAFLNRVPEQVFSAGRKQVFLNSIFQQVTTGAGTVEFRLADERDITEALRDLEDVMLVPGHILYSAVETQAAAQSAVMAAAVAQQQQAAAAAQAAAGADPAASAAAYAAQQQQQLLLAQQQQQQQQQQQ